MRMNAVSILLCTFHLSGLCSSAHLPRDVSAYVENAEACEHFGGEYDSELPFDQKREIENGIRKYCSAANRQLSMLRKKYRRDPAMLAVINRHANEAVTDYR
ncbi:hypothetical protein [Pseudoduganella umbonata]|uniref:Uncharacterized protein n=1 Tax=Pseudoduganella umbonata TaxID=864828 RepID=A0A4V1ED93_9BURK|nr:hypothetical protein [Pseudoduganella umbonata]MBB3221084.1 hypothetical protein [Pseudoduganella umbonata]QCP10281.1 hypothetical protein FCL38_07465 [Pseudoduganella umbonata]